MTHTTDLGTYWLSKYGEYWLWVNHLVNWSVSKQQQQTSEVQPIYLNLDSDESDHKREMSATANSIGAKREQHEDTSQEQSFHTFNEYPLSVPIDL